MTEANPWRAGTAPSRPEASEEILDTDGSDREGEGDKKALSQSQTPKRSQVSKLSVQSSGLSASNENQDGLFTQDHFPSEPLAKISKLSDDAMAENLQGELLGNPYKPPGRNDNSIVLKILEAYRNLRSSMTKRGTAGFKNGGDRRADKKGADPESLKDDEIRKRREQLREATEMLRTAPEEYSEDVDKNPSEYVFTVKARCAPRDLPWEWIRADLDHQIPAPSSKQGSAEGPKPAADGGNKSFLSRVLKRRQKPRPPRPYSFIPGEPDILSVRRGSRASVSASSRSIPVPVAVSDVAPARVSQKLVAEEKHLAGREPSTAQQLT